MSSQSIFVTCCIMKNPTTIKAGAVAKDGMARKIGERNRDTRKSPAVTNDVRPDLPPSAIPDADSAKVVMVDVPKTAPAVVPKASAKRAPLIAGNFPSSSNIFALDAQPIKVPKVSKTSTKRKAKTTTRKFKENTLLKSILKKVGAIELGTEIRELGIKL